MAKEVKRVVRNGKVYRYEYAGEPNRIRQDSRGRIACLRCNKWFKSKHKFNRLCEKCNEMIREMESEQLEVYY